MKKVLLVLTVIAISGLGCVSCEAKSKKEAMVNLSSEEQVIAKKWSNVQKTPSGLLYTVTKEGKGAKPALGTLVTAHYTGTLTDGTKFDSSVDRGQPFKFQVGTGQVIKGWDEAFLDMKKGEKRVLVIPYNLAYGERGMPPVIPQRATLIFDVEMIDF
ncbi:MAG: FKBP-type peptidyl-prolyl cis-trans isomerase [bacterium]